jgi:O-antigen ligase
MAKTKFKANNFLNVYWVGILAIILAISAPWLDLSVSNHSFVKTYIGGIGIGALVLFTLFKNYKNYDINYHISYIKLFLGATFILGVLSIFWSVNPDFTIVKMLIWVTAFMAFYTAYKLDITEDNLRKLSFYLIIAGGSIAAIGILQYLFDPFTLTQAANPSSTFGNKNMATQPISMIFPLVAFVVLNKKSTVKVMWIAAILGALMLTFNFYTSTRASWIAILVEVILMSSLLIIKRKSFSEFASWNKQKTIIALTAVAVFLALINFNEHGFHPMWEKASANFNRLTSSIQNDKSLRYQIWTVAGQMIADKPFFGSGMGTWFQNVVNEGYSGYVINYVQRVHNDLIEIAVEIGIVGLAIFMAGVVAIIWAIWAIILKAETKYLLFYFALFESLTGSFANLQFSFPYQLAMPALLFGLYIGLIAKKSEEFIKPIKVFKLDLKTKSAKLYKKIVLSFNVVIFVVISSLYISWATMYSELNRINQTNEFDKLGSIVETPIYHLEVQNIMNFLTHAYMNGNNNDVAEKIVKQMLKYWPNDYVTRTRYAHILYKKGQYAKALVEAKKAKKNSPPNSMHANSIIFATTLQTKQYDEYIKNFNEIMQVPKDILGDNPRSYNFLMSQALKINTLNKYMPELYVLHNKYNGYSCTVESNLLHYYLLNNDKNLKPAFEKEFKNPTNCINRNIINQVKSKFKI